MGFSLFVTVKTNTDKLDSIVSALPGVGDSIGDLASEVIVTRARSIVPVDTGFLKSTIGRARRGRGWVVFALAAYAGFVEFGTRKMAAQPFLRPAFESVGWASIIQQAFRRIGL